MALSMPLFLPLRPEHQPHARHTQQSYAQQRKPYAALIARNAHVVGVIRIIQHLDAVAFTTEWQIALLRYIRLAVALCLVAYAHLPVRTPLPVPVFSLIAELVYHTGGMAQSSRSLRQRHKPIDASAEHEQSYDKEQKTNNRIARRHGTSPFRSLLRISFICCVFHNLNHFCYKDSQRREQRQIKNNKVFHLTLPSRTLSYLKIAKGESNDK